MNILFITPSFPLRLHRVRAYHLIKCLAKQHKIFLLSLYWDKDVSDFAEIRKFCAYAEVVHKKKISGVLDAFRYLFSSLPLEVAYCRDTKMAEKVKEYVRRYKIDLIYIKRLRAAQFVKDCSVPVLLDTTDAMSLFYGRAARAVPWYKKLLYYEEAVKYRWYEKKMLRKFKNWVVSSSIDADYLRAMAPPDTAIHVVPNGVDMEYFFPKEATPDRHTIIFSGLMDKFINIEAAEYFVKDVFPYILKDVPDAKLKIVGPDPARKIGKLAGPRIEVVGFALDLREYIAKAEVVVCPVKTGAGTRNKILQAWAMKKPVVSTTQGIEGLEYENGKSALVADSSRDFARAVLDLFSSAELKNRLAENGYALVQEKYRMERITEQLNSIIENLMSISQRHENRV